MIARTHAWLLIFCLLAISLTGCRVGPDYCSPAIPVPDVWHQQLENGSYANSEEVRQWWTLFNDPLLNDMVYTAGEQNLDLYAAYQRIQQARAQTDIAYSPRLAWLDAAGSFQHSKQSENAIGLGGIPLFFLRPRDVWGLGFDTSWEPDVFGRITRQIEAAEAAQCATIEAYRDIMVSLYAEVARNYVLARTLQARLEFAHRNTKIQRESLDLAKVRVESGVAAIFDQYQAESNLANTEAEIPPLNAQLQQTLNRLAVLLGEYPGALHEVMMPNAPLPEIGAGMPITLPCDVVRQRPDIRQAERLYAARVAEVGVATADLYPRFAINGTFNLQAQNLSDLLETRSFSYGFGPSFRWAIFHAGQVLSNIDGSKAAAEEAFAQYQQTVLLAAEEVENAVVAYNTELERRESLRRVVTSAEQSLEKLLFSYKKGNTDFLNVLDTQRTLFQAQNQLAASEGQVVINVVNIYMALGGGWDPNHHCVDRCVRIHCPATRAPLYRYEPQAFDVRQDDETPAETPDSGTEATPEVDSDASPSDAIAPL
jgi:NodT family efflux transporter outer membrane factor (OMF) lipoprotein